MKTIDLEPNDVRLAAEVLPVLRQLRPHLTEELFREIYAEGHAQGLRFTAAYDEDDVCVGVAGWRMIVNTSAIRQLYVDDLVTAENSRSSGVGHHLLSYLESKAREHGCHSLHLDSGTHRTHAHRFYLRERLDIVAFHFAKGLD